MLRVSCAKGSPREAGIPTGVSWCLLPKASLCGWLLFINLPRRLEDSKFHKVILMRQTNYDKSEVLRIINPFAAE